MPLTKYSEEFFLKRACCRNPVLKHLCF